MTTNTAPTKELGHGGLTVTPWNSLYDETEEVAALAWPQCIDVYDRMRNDAQIAALFLALLLPIYRYEWYIDPNGAEDNIVQHVAEDVGLPILGVEPGPRGRAKGRFNFAEHLKDALPLPLRYGNFFCEQVYSVDDGKDPLLHLRKLSPRMPRTISQIVADQQGSLQGIVQYPTFGSNYLNGQQLFAKTSKITPINSNITPQGIPIPVDRLVAYVHEREGSNWFGHSMLRSLFREFTIKDKELRINTISHERNGAGVAIAKAPQNATSRQVDALQAVVNQIKASEVGGAVVPYGSEVTLEGVRGTLPDSLETIHAMNQAMSRRFLGMFMDLGATTGGNRALGDTFVDQFKLVQESTAENFTDTFNAYVIEDLVDLNWGIDVGVPKLAFRAEAKKELAIEELKILVDTGALIPDDSLREFLRDKFELPKQDAPTKIQEPKQDPKPDEAAPKEDPGTPTEDNKKAAAKLNKPYMIREDDIDCVLNPPGSASVFKNVAEKRKPNEHEVAAGTDFAAIESAFTSAVDFLVGQWTTQVKAPQIDSLVAQIEQAGPDLVALAAIDAPILGAEILSQELMRAVAQATSQAVIEAATQGIEITPPTPESFADAMNQRAQAMTTIMAKSISEAAARNAITYAGTTTDAAELAAAVKAHLTGLTDTYLTDNLGAAVHTAQNDARFETLNQGPVRYWYASELIDTPNICRNCSDVNDREYQTLEDARRDYPAGFYRNCSGGVRCRGSLVAIFKEESLPTVDDVQHPSFE
jgi:hypothetical protein